MARRYLVRPLPDPGPCDLPDDIARHAGRVMRSRAGDVLRLFDGEGHEAEARIVEVGRHAMRAEVGQPMAVEREPGLRVELAVALPKGARADWLFEHATEIGVAAFRPVVSERGQRPTRSERWERIVAAAATQCDRSRLPAIHAPCSLDQLAADPGLPAARFVLAPGSTTELGAGGAARNLVLVGPEGGFSDGELARLDAAGFARRGLGALTLRVETAAVVAIARLLAPHQDPPSG